MLRRRSADERGATLVEVLVSAVLLVVAGGGLLSAIDAAGNQSNEQRHQAIAADLAQTELERLTGLRFQDVDDLSVTHPPRNVQGTDYTIQSVATWALQTPTGPAACSTAGRSPEALKLTVTVTWPKMSRKAVTMTSMRAAPTSASTGKGSFIVQVTDRNGNGVSGLAISMNGPSPMSGSTDATGCIRFNEMTAAQYALTFNAGTRIYAETGLPDVSENVDVVAGQTRSAIYEVDTPGTLNLTSFRFYNGSGYTTSTRPNHVSLSHASLISGPITAPVTGATFTKTGLYPFAGAYGVYADSCTASAPPAGNLLNATITPGGTASSALTLPALSIEPDDAFAGDDVYVRTACGNIYGPRDLVNSGGIIRLRDGYPYGDVDICVIRQGSNPKRWIDKPNVDNDSYSGYTTAPDDGSNGFDMDNYSTSTNPGVCGWSGFNPS